MVWSFIKFKEFEYKIFHIEIFTIASMGYYEIYLMGYYEIYLMYVAWIKCAIYSLATNWIGIDLTSGMVWS